MEITIQRDGRIAIREHREEVRYADPENPYALFEIMRAALTLEDGLTVRQLMRCLRPWKASLSASAWMNFDAWLEKMDQTHVVDAATDDNDRLSQIEISCYVDLNRFDDDIFLHLNTHWSVRGRLVTPFEEHGHVHETCGITFTDPKRYSNLPLKIIPYAAVHDHNVGNPQGCRPVLKSRRPGVYSAIKLCPTLFDTIIMGFLDDVSFHGDPVDTEDRFGEILERLEEVKSITENRADGEDELSPEGSERRSMTMDEFFEELSLGDLNERINALRELEEALTHVSFKDTELQEKLGLTALGLWEVESEITAQFSVAKLREMRDIIDTHWKAKAG